jgi:hypothetical protein
MLWMRERLGIMQLRVQALCQQIVVRVPGIYGMQGVLQSGIRGRDSMVEW